LRHFERIAPAIITSTPGLLSRGKEREFGVENIGRLWYYLENFLSEAKGLAPAAFCRRRKKAQ
jgi:hypothetical protein